MRPTFADPRNGNPTTNSQPPVEGWAALANERTTYDPNLRHGRTQPGCRSRHTDNRGRGHALPVRDGAPRQPEVDGRTTPGLLEQVRELEALIRRRLPRYPESPP